MNNEARGLPLKIMYVVLAVICILVGLLGLLIPVIPGILFLLAAVYLIGRVSYRFRMWADQQPLLAKLSGAFSTRNFSRMKDLPVWTKIKVAGLMVLSSMASSIGFVVARIKGRK